MLFTLIFTGNLAYDPRISTLKSGDEASNLVVITNDPWTDDNGNKHDRKLTFRVSVTNGNAKPCNQYLKKGREVTVVGRLVADEWGNPRTYEKKNAIVNLNNKIMGWVHHANSTEADKKLEVLTRLDNAIGDELTRFAKDDVRTSFEVRAREVHFGARVPTDVGNGSVSTSGEADTDGIPF